VLIPVLVLGYIFFQQAGGSIKKTRVPAAKKIRAAPVETAAIEQGPMTLRRTFSGTLASNAEFLVAPKVSGRVEHLAVDMGDPVFRKQEVARLDNDEYVQAVAQANADLAVAEADLTGAQNARDIAQRELDRMETLKKRGVSSASQVDAARADWLAAKARVEMARAQIQKVRAQLETTRIRLGYTTVFADWTGGSDTAVHGGKICHRRGHGFRQHPFGIHCGTGPAAGSFVCHGKRLWPA
jgi:multidrug efflux pump subunit AcrA (membrane-fusion protein)